MLKKNLLGALLALVLTSHAEAGLIDNIKNYFLGEKNYPPAIRVLIVNDKPGVQLEMKGKYRIYDPNDMSHLSTRFIGKKNLMQSISSGLKWGEEFPGVHQLLIVPDSPKVTAVIDGKEYSGKIYVYDIGGTVSIVNEIDLEEYVQSLLAPEFPEEVPEEALASLTIAARTNALWQAMHPRNQFWDVDASVVDYQGYGVTAPHNAVTKAVQATRYMVMNQPAAGNGKLDPFPAVWGSNTGGAKRNNQQIFSRISLYDAEKMAQNGDDARMILKKAFPGSTIVLSY